MLATGDEMSSEVTRGWVRWAQDWRKRYGDGPMCFWTDSCCFEEAFLLKVFPTLKPGRAYDLEALSRLPAFAGAVPVLVETAAHCGAACAELSKVAVLGFDLEWAVGASLSLPVSTVQLASESHSYVFQLNKLVSPGRELPAALTDLLANAAVSKVGVACKGDATRLRSAFSCEVNGLIDLKDHAIEMQLNMTSYSLAALTQRVLGQKLDKSIELRLSSWDAPTLSIDQIRYAAFDASASLLIYNALRDGNVPDSMEEDVPDLSLAELEAELKSLMERVSESGAGRGGVASPAARDAVRTAFEASPPPPAGETPLAKTARYCTILLDVLHLMMRLEEGCTTKKDPLFGFFFRKVKEAIFIKNADDVKLLTKWLVECRGMTMAEVENLPSSYHHDRVRRLIPPPAELAVRLLRVIRMFEHDSQGRPVLCSDGRPFFREGKAEAGRRSGDGMIAIVMKLLRHILKGCVSDPPNLPMYFPITGGKDDEPQMTEAGLVRWKGIRSSSQQEGYHFHKREAAGANTMGPELIHIEDSFFNYCWNIKAGRRYLNEPDTGHFHLELMDEMYAAYVQAYGSECVHARSLCVALRCATC